MQLEPKITFAEISGEKKRLEKYAKKQEANPYKMRVGEKLFQNMPFLGIFNKNKNKQEYKKKRALRTWHL